MKYQEAKRTAKLVLKDNWIAAMIVTAIKITFLLLILYLTQMFLLVILYPILVLFFYMPNRVGTYSWYFAQAKGEEPPISKVFDFFHGAGFTRSISYTLLYVASMFGWTVLFCAPIVAAQIYFFGDQEVWWMELLLIFAFAFAVVWNTVRLFLVPYILAENSEVKVTQAFRMSARYMRKNKIELVLLFLSFAGWFVLSLLIVPMIYTKPYYDASKAVFAKKVLDENTVMVAEESEEYNGGIPEEISA